MSRIATFAIISAPGPADWIWIIITAKATATATATAIAMITIMTMTMTTGIITIPIRMLITRLVLNRCAIASRPASLVDDRRLWGAI